MSRSRNSTRRAGPIAALTIVLAASANFCAAMAQDAPTRRFVGGPLEWIGVATSVPEASDFVRENRPDPKTLKYMNIGTPRAEPDSPRATADEVKARESAADARRGTRDALAAGRPQPKAPPKLPASALKAKAQYDAMMRERATGAR